MSTPSPIRRIAIPCGRPGCRRPAGYISIQDGRLVIEIQSRHNGEPHTTRLTVDDAADMLGVTALPSLERAGP